MLRIVLILLITFAVIGCTEPEKASGQDAEVRPIAKLFIFKKFREAREKRAAIRAGAQINTISGDHNQVIQSAGSSCPGEGCHQKQVHCQTGDCAHPSAVAKCCPKKCCQKQCCQPACCQTTVTTCCVTVVGHTLAKCGCCQPAVMCGEILIGCGDPTPVEPDPEPEPEPKE